MTPEPPPAPQEDGEDSRPRLTDEQRQQGQHTNRGNRDDIYTEGNVVDVHLEEQLPYVTIVNLDGLQRVVLLCGSRCPTIQVGDYLEASGVKQSEALFEATDVTVTAPGR